MKLAPPDDRHGLTPPRVLVALFLCALLPLLAYAAAPAWWSERGVTIATATPDDYAPVNQGQLKNIAAAAMAELDAKLPGGAGEALHHFVNTWSASIPRTNDFAPVNLGQLKQAAAPFYDRLISAGLAENYPWAEAAAASDDFAIANIGQVKNLFNFELLITDPPQDGFGDRVAAGVWSANLALDATGTAWIWGDRISEGGSSYDRTYPRRIKGLSALSSVSAGDRHLVALRSGGGTVWSWGQNDYGQLGNGSNVSHTTPAPVPNLANVTSVKAGGIHNLALQQDGTVVAWGDNEYGQLGTGDTADSLRPTPVVGLSDVRRIAAGAYRSVALKNDGTVWTWGYEQHGPDVFYVTPTLVPDLTDVVDIAAGYRHVVAVKADGTVWAWGSNDANQIANGNAWWQFQSTPVQVPDLPTIIAVASKYDHTLAVAGDGTVWAWGSNHAGQLGDGTTQARRTPVRVTGLTDVVAISNDYLESVAMKADGSVWAWGQGANGIDPGADLYVPQPVVLGLLDRNGNGMDDRWESEFFGNLEQTADGDADGDGISNQQEFLRNTDPTDYFNGTTPVIEIVSGNNQVGDAGTVAPQPLAVLVRNSTGDIASNAPVVFTISSGSGVLLEAESSGLQDIVVRTGTDGIASVQFAFSEISGISSRITAVAGKLANKVSSIFRLVARFRATATPPPTPSTSPGPSPTPTPVSTSTAPPPQRYAIVDLGKDMYPIRVANNGWVLLQGWTNDYGWSYFRWKAGVLERLTHLGEYSEIVANDMNDNGVVVGSGANGQWIRDAENEIQAGMLWPANSSTPTKVSAPGVFWNWDWRNPGDIRQAHVTAIANNNEMYGGAKTGGGYGFFYYPLSVINAHRWIAEPPSVEQLSFCVATVMEDPNSPFPTTVFTGHMDSIARANSKREYIGTRTQPEPLWGSGPSSGMVNGQDVEFAPKDINEAGIVVGDAPNGAGMVIRRPGRPDQMIDGIYPIAVNSRTRPAASTAAVPGASAAPSPTPVPAPQILSWAGNTTALWELLEDGETWHAVGLEEMIPSMEGWEIWDIDDINDDGVIVGSGGFKDPANPQAETEWHAYMLVPVGLMVDANRDGEMSFEDRAIREQDETTTADKPYRFWINDDNDGAGEGSEALEPPADFDDRIIASKRDLEDFTRLWATFHGITGLLKAPGVTVHLEWKTNRGDTNWQEADGSPIVHIYKAAETDGGTRYLSQEASAASQVSDSNKAAIGYVTRYLPMTFPGTYFANLTEEAPHKYFLFEGAGSGGKGQLVLTIKKHGQAIGTYPPVFLDIKPVKSMYVRAKGSPVNGITAPWDTTTSEVTDYMLDPNGHDFQQPPDELKKIIVYTHGIHPPFVGQDDAYKGNIATAESAFKRLWHSGYKGRFAFYKWPALNPAGFFTSGTGFEFNQSEYRAWKYGRGLARFAGSVPADYQRHVFAHSQGNAVVAAAFKNYGLSARTWIITQGAIPISCYDTKLAHYVFPFVTPDLSTDLGYRGFLDAAVPAKVVNFFNRDDRVTGRIWEINQEYFKPTVELVGITRVEYWYYAGSGELSMRKFFNNVLLSERAVTDVHESMAMLVKSRSKAIGQGFGAQGQVDVPVDLHAEFGFGDEHGSQWDRSIQQNVLPYYRRLLNEIE